jgi:phenylalanyl-tRNA synthetase alpha chain
LTELPENPVGRILHELRSVFSDFTEHVVPEIVDLVEARKTIVNDAVYLDPVELHRIDDRKILRYDLTLPFLLSVRDTGESLRAWIAGKAYRVCKVDATHLEAFHQAEAFWIDERARLDPWYMTGRVLQSMDRVLPERAVKVVPTVYPMCKQAWELEVEDDGHWFEVLAWGIFTDKIVSRLGVDPNRYIAVGVGYGLERLAMLRYHIDDIRKIEISSVA